MLRYTGWLMALCAMALFQCSAPNQNPPTVRSLASPADSVSAEPFLSASSDGTVYLSWVSVTPEGHSMRFASLTGDTWSAVHEIDTGRHWFVNWADYPMMAVNGDTFLASYLRKSGPDKFSYDIQLVVSSDKGNTWRRAGLLNEDGLEAEHGFTALLPKDSGFVVSWLDGRHTAMAAGHEGHDGHHGNMSLRAAVLDLTAQKKKEWELDSRTCDCCNTAMTMTDLGPIVLYRDRSEGEIRDISVVRLLGEQWTEPVSIYADNWEINGCPVNGPRVVSGGSTVVAAWFSMPGDDAQVKVAFSDNNGESFGKPVRLDSGKAIGRIDVEWISEDEVFVMWMEGSDIMGARVGADGIGWKIKVVTTTEARSSGFPQVVRSGERLVLAWTDDELKRVQTAVIGLKEGQTK